MVRTIGLCRALGRVLGRVLGREVAGDEEEAPQCWRPTTSARRQQTTATIAEDVDHVDHVSNEVHE